MQGKCTVGARFLHGWCRQRTFSGWFERRPLARTLRSCADALRLCVNALRLRADALRSQLNALRSDRKRTAFFSFISSCCFSATKIMVVFLNRLPPWNAVLQKMHLFCIRNNRSKSFFVYLLALLYLRSRILQMYEKFAPISPFLGSATDASRLRYVVRVATGTW